MIRKFILLIAVSLSLQFTNAQVYQWSVTVESEISSETNSSPQAFLWIPENCKQVKGIVVGMHNMIEEGILEHPDFRKTMSDVGIAEIWLTPAVDMLFAPSKGAQEAFDEMLKKLADVSGYTEIATAPIVPIGHSACASYPWNFAALNPQKTLAILSIHGDAPQTNLTGCGRPNLNWGNHNINGIPGLMVMGEYEWWEDRLAPAIEYKNNHPQTAISLLADAGHGHFDYSDMLVHYLALFIKEAAKYRLTDGKELKPIDPKAGWLADRWHPEQEPPQSKAAPYNQYKGNKAEAFWYFDKKMAKETEKYYAATRAKKDQYIGITQKGKMLNYNKKSHAMCKGKFHPESDGLTFHISATFTDSLRTMPSREHSVKGTIKIDRICGPVEKINDSTFTIRFYRMGLNNTKRTGDIWLIAHNEGDKVYKSSVQQINVRIPFKNQVGKEQHITFPEIENITEGNSLVSLNAISDSGLPVYYYVKEGPAKIVDNRLVFTKIPPRTKFPVKVSVVAWQYGKSTKPEVQTANPVEQSFYIIKKLTTN